MFCLYECGRDRPERKGMGIMTKVPRLNILLSIISISTPDHALFIKQMGAELGLKEKVCVALSARNFLGQYLFFFFQPSHISETVKQA